MPATLAKSLRDDRVGALRLCDPIAINPTASVEEAILRMASRRQGCALVMRDGRLDGIFTERDYLSRVIAQHGDVRQPIENVMTSSPRTITQFDSIETAIELMQTGGYRHLPVVDEAGQPVGILSVRDVVHYLAEYFPSNVYNLPPAPDTVNPVSREGA